MQYSEWQHRAAFRPKFQLALRRPAIHVRQRSCWQNAAHLSSNNRNCLSATISQYFHWRHDAHSRLILCNSDKRSSKFGFTGGWQCYDGPAFQQYWTGDTAKEDTLDYATAPAKFEGREFCGLIFRLPER